MSTCLETPEAIVVDASNRMAVSLRQLPANCCVWLISAGNAGPEFRLTLDLPHMAELHLVGCLAARVVLEGRVRIDRLSISGPAAAMPIELHSAVGLECTELTVECATVHLDRPALGLSVLRLSDAGLSIDRPLHVERLVVRGQVTFQTRGFQADGTSLPDGRASLRSRFGTVGLGVVVASGPQLRLSGGVANTFTATKLPSASTITLDDSSVDLVRSGAAQNPPIADVVLMGTGDARIYVPLLRPRFEPNDDGELRVTILQDGSIADAVGRINLVEARGGSVTGSRGRGSLTLIGVGELEGVDLENVSLFDLPDLESLQRLAMARRVVPWMPRVWRARALQQRQFSGADCWDERDRWSRVARFWSDVGATLHRSETSGGVQSDVRVAVLRARRRSLSPRDNTREWMLLTAYALLGYGERVLAPLVVWTSTCLSAAAALRVLPITNGSEGYWRVFVRLLAAPLTLVNVDVAIPNAPGIWDNAMYGGSKFAGVVLVGVAVMAGRRTVRPNLGR